LVRDVVGSGVQDAADAVATADAHVTLARAAREGRYTRQEVVEEPVLALSESRHPVLERLLPAGDFVPNDCVLDARTRQILIITGPNMAGKSTFLRQTGLMRSDRSILFRGPCRLGLVNRVFTRVGLPQHRSRAIDVPGGNGRASAILAMRESLVLLDGSARAPAPATV
jgi:DNA mismatch repair protein MutS